MNRTSTVIQILMEGKKKDRRKGRRQMKFSEGTFLEPQSHLQSCDPFLKQCMKKVRHQSQLNMAKDQLKGLCGRHSAINYKDEYEFQESWQSGKKSQQIRRKYSQPINENKIINVFQSLLVVLFGMVFWFLSVYRIFQIDFVSYYLASVVMIIQITDVTILEIISKHSNQDKTVLRQKIKKYSLSVALILYMALIMVEFKTTSSRTILLLPIDIVFMIKTYKRLKKLYILLKIRMPAVWRNQMEISQLVIGSLFLVHLFSLVLYMAAQANDHKNWTLSIDDFHHCWLNSYLYSLYFACSTMFTVGYGDVTPKNLWEISTILVVQVIGIINIGYVINEVGRYVSKINEKQDILYRSISDAQKISEDYKLPEDVSKKLRSYVLDNQIAGTRFNVEQEDQFLGKLNDELRQEVSSFNRFQLVKSNIFFLCHWSNRFQKTIADKLIRHVYSPDECLTQIQGKEKLYVLNKGKIDIEANVFSVEKNIYRKILRVLEVDPNKEVHFNVYGYTSLISGLKVNLRAVAKDYSICYYVDKEIILSAINENKNDFQYFHEIRSRVEESRLKQAYEAPKIKSTKEHYIPSPYFIIKKEQRKRQGKQARRMFARQDIKKIFVIQNEENHNEIELLDGRGKRISIDKLLVSIGTERKLISQTNIEKIRSREGNFSTSDLHEEKFRIISQNFEAGHDFTYFRKKSNPRNILQSYAHFYQIVDHTKEFQQSQLMWTSLRYNYKKLNSQTVKKLLNSRTI